MNGALLAKMLWRIIKQSSELSSCILFDKYGGWPALLHGHRTAGTSHIWRALKRVFPILQLNVAWQLGNRRRISFQLGDCPLQRLCITLIPSSMSGMTVYEHWAQAQDSKYSVLENFLPPSLLDKLVALDFNGKSIVDDRPFWKGSKFGYFSVRSVRHSLQQIRQHSQHGSQKTVWKFRGPQRASFTLWTILHKALPTSQLLWRRWVISSPICL